MVMYGIQIDGYVYILVVVEKGVMVIFCEELFVEFVEGVIYIQVVDSEDVVGKVVMIFYGNLSLKLELVGVIGINGKIMIVILLYNMF